jgi:hypothetical protein
VTVEIVEEADTASPAKAAPVVRQEAPAEPVQMKEEDFKNDPFIKAAIEKFAARVVKLPKGKTT